MQTSVEKLIAEGKALVGYDQNDVREEILSLQASYEEKKARLLKEIEIAKAQNLVLKEKLNTFIQIPASSQRIDEVSEMFMKAFFEDTLVIQNLKNELESIEKPYYEKLVLRQKQKEYAKRGVQEATEFLKSLQKDVSDLKKSEGLIYER